MLTSGYLLDSYFARSEKNTLSFDMSVASEFVDAAMKS